MKFNRYINQIGLCIILFFFVACTGNKHKRKVISRYPNGTIKQEIEYLNKDSTRYISYLDSSNGQLFGTFTFHDTLMDGASSIYFPNGKLRQHGFVKNGKNNGPTYLYYPNGQLEQILHYKQGKLEGEGVQYYTNGKIKNIGYYKNDLLDGFFCAFYSDGKIAYSEYRKEDKWNGCIINYYQNGQIKAYDNYDMDKRDGRVISFYPNRKIHQYALYHEGTYVWYVEFNDNGKLIKYPKQWSRKDLVNHILNDK